MINYYLCPKCLGIVQRESKAKTIKSMCDETGQDVVLIRIDNVEKLAVKLRKKFLENLIDLSTFNPKDIFFLEMAFEQGAKVVLNRLK